LGAVFGLEDTTAIKSVIPAERVSLRNVPTNDETAAAMNPTVTPAFAGGGR
jgi:hypothetical protein